MTAMSLLQRMRLTYQPKLPQILHDITVLKAVNAEHIPVSSDIAKLFPKTAQQTVLNFLPNVEKQSRLLRVGVLFSGGQASGGHNVISGLFDALKKLNSESQLFGFLDGPKGVIDNHHIPITQELLNNYRNQGGFDLIGSGRTKIETPEQFLAAEKSCRELGLDGLVVVGGDDSNTNAAFLAEHFLSTGCKTVVVGVPKTIDGDLKNEFIETPFGFDTACKTYSEIIGNILRDALSAKKYYFFIKMMGRSASHVALECALQTHCNLTLISEEVQAKKLTLAQLVSEIADMICTRAAAGKDYGVVLIPEGLIEFIPEFKQLISELNKILAIGSVHSEGLNQAKSTEEKIRYLAPLLSQASAACYTSLPSTIKLQLLLDRDPHGNVQVSKIETERLLIEMVQLELQRRQQEGKYKGKFSSQPLFCGYEGRSCLPSNFDSQYCYALGHVAALLISEGATGYICCIQDLKKPVDEWQIAGIPLLSMMALEERQGKKKPVIKKALVDLNGKLFQLFAKSRQSWLTNDEYCYPGPIQFFGPPELTEAITCTLESHG